MSTKRASWDLLEAAVGKPTGDQIRAAEKAAADARFAALPEPLKRLNHQQRKSLRKTIEKANRAPPEGETR